MWRYLVVLAISSFVPAAAEDAEGGLIFAEQLIITEEAAAEAAKAGNRGRVLDISFDEKHEPAAYRVKMLLDDGVVRTVFIDAATGRSLER